MNVFAPILISFLIGSQSPDFPTGKVIRDRWEVLEFQSSKVGTLHTEIQSIEMDRLETKPTPYRKIRETISLEMKRFNETVKLKQVREDLETEDGFLLASKMEQFNGNTLQVSLEAKLQGEKWIIKNLQKKTSKSIILNQRAVGLGKLQEQMESRKSGVFLHYEPLVNTFIQTAIIAQSVRDGADLTLKPRSLEGGLLPLTDSTTHIDAKGEFTEREIDFPGLGRVIAIPANRANANKPTGKMLDIGSLGLIPLNRTIPAGTNPNRIIYRLYAEEGIDLGQVMAGDNRQEVRVLPDGFVELTTLPSKAPVRRIAPPPANDYISSSKIIDFSNPFIQEMARRSGAYNDDSWTAAKRLERYVQSVMVADATTPLGTAGETAQAKRGDCRHYAILLCALCRSVAIPARTATGLIYIERSRPEGGRGPFLGFHMWTEVYIDGQWIGLDGTLGKGGITPRHIKINDQSWFQEDSLAPLIPVLKLVGKLKAEILRVDANR